MLKIVYGFSLFVLLVHTTDKAKIAITKQEHCLQLFCQVYESCVIPDIIKYYLMY